MLPLKGYSDMIAGDIPLTFLFLGMPARVLTLKLHQFDQRCRVFMKSRLQGQEEFLPCPGFDDDSICGSDATFKETQPFH